MQRRREFQGHLIAYCVVNVMVWSIWVVIGLTSESWFPWPLFVTLGWGVGVVMNAREVYFRRPDLRGGDPAGDRAPQRRAPSALSVMARSRRHRGERATPRGTTLTEQLARSTSSADTVSSHM